MHVPNIYFVESLLMIHIQLCRFCIRNSTLNAKYHKELYYDYAYLGDFVGQLSYLLCSTEMHTVYSYCVDTVIDVTTSLIRICMYVCMYVCIYVGAVVVRTPTPIDDDLLVSL